MTFKARIQNPNAVVVSLSIELSLHDALRLIEQIDGIREGDSSYVTYPASMVRAGLASAVQKIKEQVTEELIPERLQG